MHLSYLFDSNQQRKGMKSMSKQKRTLVGLIIFLIFSLGQMIPTASAEEQTFKVGMEAGYPPFNWTQQDDSHGAVPIEGSPGEYAGGYDVEIAKIIAEKLGRKLVVVKTEWDGLSPGVTSGKTDAIIAGMSPTPERRKTIDFTDPYYQSNLVLVVRSDGKFKDAQSIHDFQDAKITAQLNTFHYDMIKQMDGVNQQPAWDNFPAMRVALESGVIDGYVSEKPEGITAETLNPNFKMIEFKEGDGFQTNPDDTTIAIGMKKNNPDLPKINEILASISLKEQDELMEKAIKNQPGDDNSTEEASDDVPQKAGKEENLMIKILRENWKMFLRGAGMTLFIALIGTVVGWCIGLIVGSIKTLTIPEKGIKRYVMIIVHALLTIYIEVFRGTPMIVQAMVIYYGSAQFLGVDINRTLAAVVIVSINTGAYMSEIVRGGIFAVDKGQFEAAQAIGMKHSQTMLHIVIPQVIRNILPATGNEFVINIKDTSVLNVIAVSELYFQTKTVAGQNLHYFATFFIACAIYLFMTLTVTQILKFVERKIDGPTAYEMITHNEDEIILENEVGDK